MAKTLGRAVSIQNPETGEYVTLDAGSELPAWGEKLVTNPKAFTEPEVAELPAQIGAVKGDGELRAAANAPEEPAEAPYSDGTVLTERTAVQVVGTEVDSEGDEDSGENEGVEPPAAGRRAKEAPARKA